MRELKQDWRDVFRAFRLGLDIWKILLALCGLVTSAVALKLLVELQEAGNWVPLALAGFGCWALLLVSMLRSEEGLDAKKVVALVVVGVVLGGLVILFGEHLSERVVLGLGVVVVLTLVWALFGGAIARSAVVELATDERLGVGEALKYAVVRYRHYAWSVLAPLVGLALFLLIMALGGVVAKVPVLDVLVSFTTLLYLLAGFIVMLILVGLVVGWPLLFPAISAEGSDSFDAISRAYSYIYSKPWRYIWYQLVGKAYGIACAAFIVLFSAGLLISADRALSLGMGAPYKQTVGPGIRRVVAWFVPEAHVPKKLAGGSEAAAQETEEGRLLRRVRHLVPAFEAPKVTLKGTRAVTATIAGVITAVFLMGVVACIISLWASRQCIIYLLMRKAVDGTDMTEVFQEEKEGEDYLGKVAGGKGEAEEEAKPEEGEEPSAESSAEEGGGEEKSEGESPRRPRRRTPRRKEGESE